MKCIYKFHVNCGRMGMLEGVFIRERDEVEKLMGKTIFFSDVLGKHSEIEVEINPKNLICVSMIESEVLLVEHLELSNGINPFDYYDDYDDEDEEV